MTNMTKQTQVRSTEKALKLALEGIESMTAWEHPDDPSHPWTDCAKLIREALASEAIEQPARHEPVAWLVDNGGDSILIRHSQNFPGVFAGSEFNKRPLVFGDISPPAQPQEPVAIGWYIEGFSCVLGPIRPEVRYEEWRPFYALRTPPQRTWVGLTDEDIKGEDWVLSAVKEHEAYTYQEQLAVEGVDGFARAIEAKLREKNAQPSKPLTDERIFELASEHQDWDRNLIRVRSFARAIEAAHGIKGDA